MTTLEFRSELIHRLNNNASRYHGGTCNGKYFPEVERRMKYERGK